MNAAARSGAGFALLLVALGGLTNPAWAQGTADSPPEFLTAAPDDPAFIFLGVTPTMVTQPSTIRDFGFALANVIGKQGQVQQGFSLSATPWLLSGLDLSLETYQGDWLKRMLSNTQLSVATAKAAGDSASTDIAFGIRIQLIDGADPMIDRAFTEELGDAMLAELAECTDDPTATEDEVNACLDEGVRANAVRRVNQLFSEQTKRVWNAYQLSAGLALGQHVPNSQWSARQYSGLQTWMVGSMPIGKTGGSAKLLGQIGYTQNQQLDDRSAADVLTFGSRIIVGSPTLNGFYERAAEKRSGTSDGTNGTHWSWSGGIELRVSESFWLSTGFGNRYNEFEDADRTFVIADLRWVRSSKARLSGIGGGQYGS